MLLIAALAMSAFVLSRRSLRKALPFESLVAIGAAALITLAFFQIDRLG